MNAKTQHEGRTDEISGHTEGPWYVRTYDTDTAHGLVGIYDRETVDPYAYHRGMIVQHVWGKNLAQCDANIRLIRAAPELLEALELLVTSPVVYNDNELIITCGSHGEAMAIIRKARAALSSAYGTDGKQVIGHD